MNIDVGDYFVITRGREMNTSGLGSFASIVFGGSEDWKQPKDSKPQYDRSYTDCIFQAVAVEGQMVAAKLVYRTHGYGADVMSMNTAEYELMTVGKDYVRAMGVEVSP